MSGYDALQTKAMVLVCASASTVFGARSALSMAINDLTRDKSMGVDAAAVSVLNARGQLGYTLGKLVGGSGVDALGGPRSLLAVLAISFLSFASMARTQAGQHGNLTIAFILSKFVAAIAWSASAINIRNWCAGPLQSRSLSLGQVSLRLGGSIGSFLGGAVLARTKSWRSLLNVYAGIAALTAVAVGTGLGEPEAKKEVAAADGKEKPQHATAMQALATAAVTPKLILLYTSNTLITSTFDLGSILPQFLSDEYKMDGGAIGSIGGMFPLFSPPAIFAGTFALGRLGRGPGRMAFLAAVQAMAAAGYMVLSNRPSRAALAPALVAISAGCTPALCCVPPDWIMTWGGPHGGMFTGLQDIAGNLLTTMIYARLPGLLKKGGWPLVMRLYALQVVLGAACMAGFQALETLEPTVDSPFVLEAEEKKKA